MRLKGMINVRLLNDYAASVVQFVGGIQARARAVLPILWPPMEAPEGFYTAAAYYRDAGPPANPVSGFSFHWTVDESSRDAFFAVVNARGAAWGALRSTPAPLLPDAAAFFSPFGRHGDLDFPDGKFPRDEWKAGSINRDALEAVRRGINDAIASLYDRLAPYLDSEQLVGWTFLVGKAWTWTPDTPPGAEDVTTQEAFPQLVSEIAEEDVPFLFPFGTAEGSDTVWDATIKSVQFKRHAAEQIIDALQVTLIDGAEYGLSEGIRQGVTIWKRGKQASFRGP